MSNLPKGYEWLAKEPGPRNILESVKLLGIVEGAGNANNKTILGWAKEVSKWAPTKYNDWAADWYNGDEIPWCGLDMAVVVVRGGIESGKLRLDRQPPNSYLSALAWSSYGQSVNKDSAMLGDILVFTRKGGGHVAQYIGEDSTHFHIIGGNQSNAHSIMRKAKKDLYAVRRPPYRVMPANVRKIFLSSKGAPVSTNEQ